MSALSLLAKAEWCLSVERWAQAHAALSKARRGAASDPFLKAEILHKDAEALREMGRFRDSLLLYRSAHALYKTLRVPSERWAVLLGASACLRILGRYAEARRMWASAETGVSPSGRAPAPVELERALVARGEGRFLETRQRVDRAIRGLRRDTTPAGRSDLQHAHWILGGCDRFTGRFRRALLSFGEAVRLARRSGDVSSESYARCGLAGVQRVLGEGRSSLSNYKKAHGVFKKKGDRFGEAYGLCGQANAHRTYGEAGRALPLYRRSATLYRRLGDESSEGFAYWGLGGSLRRLQRFTEARTAYAAARRLFVKSKDDRGVVMAHLGLARVAEDQGRTLPAIREAKRGLAVARRAALRYEIALARYELNRVLRPVLRGGIRSFRSRFGSRGKRSGSRPVAPPALAGLTALGISLRGVRRWRDIP